MDKDEEQENCNFSPHKVKETTFHFFYDGDKSVFVIENTFMCLSVLELVGFLGDDGRILSKRQ